MRRFVFLMGLTAGIVFGAHAQEAPPAPTEAPVPQVQDSRGLKFPYIGQGTYSPVEPGSVPQNVQSSFGNEYSGITGTTWEYNNDVYRSSFMQDGRRRSVIYGQDGRVLETRTSTTLDDLPSSIQNSVRGKNVTSPSEIKVGDNTFYSTQVEGKEVYYDSEGNEVTIPRAGNN